MTLQHVEDVQAKHLIVNEPSILVPYQVSGPAMDIFDFPASDIVHVTNTAREEPRECIHEHLFRRIILTGDGSSWLRWIVVGIILHVQDKDAGLAKSNGNLNTVESFNGKEQYTHFIGALWSMGGKLRTLSFWFVAWAIASNSFTIFACVEFGKLLL